MQIEPLAIADVKLIEPTVIRDGRGVFCETYSTRALAEVGIDATFVQDNHSLSVKKGVVRGLHFQIPPRAQDKLVRVIRGSIFDVAVDIREGSPSYGQHISVVSQLTTGSNCGCQTGLRMGSVRSNPIPRCFTR